MEDTINVTPIFYNVYEMNGNQQPYLVIVLQII